MLRNYLTVAWRTLTQQKGFSAINIVGLAIGMTGCLLLLALVRDQDRRDEHHPHADRIYRVLSNTPTYGADDWFATSPGPLGPALKRQAPGVEEVVRLRDGSFNIVRRNEPFSLRGLYAPPSFFEVFAFPLAAGDPETALEKPRSVVLSRATAQRVFGSADPLGQAVTVETRARDEVGVFTVTGVLAETDAGSHLAADMYLSFSTLTSAKTVAFKPDSWTRTGSITSPYFTYLRLAEKASPADVAARMDRIIEPHSDEKRLSTDSLALQPLTGIHLGPDLLGEMRQSGIVEPSYLYMLGGLALLILLAAGFNYANLSVARSLSRAKEIGVRKTVGAQREQVAAQFLGESVLMALLALPIAFGLLQGLVPFFNDLRPVEHFQAQFAPADLMSLPLLLLLVGFAVAVGLVAGAYPALHLSRFDPVRVLKRSGTGHAGRSSGLISVRKGLIVLQFVMTLGFTITAVQIYRQAGHLVHADYGFDAERLIYVDLQDAPPQAFRQQATRLPGVESVSMASSVPGPIVNQGYPRKAQLRRAAEQADSTRDGTEAYDYSVSPSYAENMGVRLAAGGKAPRTAFADGSSAIINEEAMRTLGFASPAQAVGALVRYGDDPLRVIGVMDAYTYTDPTGKPAPLLLRHDPERYQYALVRARPGAMENVETGLQNLWDQFDAVHPLDYGRYKATVERNTAVLVEWATVIGGAALLAVLIACLGLLGMAAYNVRTRTQEIGIRKALGASAVDLVWLLSKEYLWLVAGAAAFTLPLAYGVDRWWLSPSPHRIDVGWTPVLCTGALLALALAAVGTQTVRAASANPADSLREE
jgi:putative ABC transport system permease protein